MNIVQVEDQNSEKHISDVQENLEHAIENAIENKNYTTLNYLVQQLDPQFYNMFVSLLISKYRKKHDNDEKYLQLIKNIANQFNKASKQMLINSINRYIKVQKNVLSRPRCPNKENISKTLKLLIDIVSDLESISTEPLHNTDM